ncbi:MAG: DUF262 domain-containing HNH endonuclease family protein [Bdellovibrionales bacterium]|nr:DUF262 domain-containing HNH endonuclease family protein [Bdellovibrionales bacterium]
MIQFDTKNQSFRQVMGNGLKYTVPRFQRDYSWQEEQWYDLWQDIHKADEHSTDTNNPHYMGYLVLQSIDNKNFTIIDGQQRLTTISIIILSALYELNELVNSNIHPNDNKKRMETLRHSFIGFTDPVSLLSKNKLTLNRNNETFFKTYLCSVTEPPVRKIKRSEKLMGQALKYFKKELKIHLQSQNSGKKIAQLIEDIADRLIFTTITVDKDANAYAVFETLNARGVQLSTPDLVKNYIFSLIDNNRQLHDSAIKTLEDKWSNIIHQLGKHKFSDFIRVDWNSKNNFSRASELFKKIKSQLDNPQKAQEYLEGLQKNSQIYSALLDHNDDFWKNYQDGSYNTEQLKLSLHTLNLFHISVPHSVLIAAFHKFKTDDFIKLLYYIEVISIRYNIICGKSSNQQERIYCEIARTITKSSNPSSNKILKLLKKIYPQDEDFLHSFNTKIFKTQQTNKKARYLLYRIEKYLSRGGNGGIDFDSVTLEHILPANPGENWIKEFEYSDQVEEWIDRIGNFTLISSEKNKDISRKEYEKKKMLFKISNFKITKKCAEYNQWNEISILNHQKWLGEQAKNLWRLPDL